MYRRLGRSEHRSFDERQMEVRGALQFLRLFLFAETASDVAERRVGGKRLRVEVDRDGRAVNFFTRDRGSIGITRDGGTVGSLLSLFTGGRRGLIFPGFELRAIFRREDLGALQIFFGVNVLGFFLLRFFASTFLLGGVGDILSMTLRGDNHGAGKKQNARQAQTSGTEGTPHGYRGAHRSGHVEISS